MSRGDFGLTRMHEQWTRFSERITMAVIGKRRALSALRTGRPAAWWVAYAQQQHAGDA